MEDLGAWLSAQPPICFTCGDRHDPGQGCPDFIRLCGTCLTFHRASEPHEKEF